MTETAFGKELSIEETNIPGMLVIDLPVHGDSRGWFKENWQREKMLPFGLPDFGPVQNNVSFNATKGSTRGLHAEPWDKFISLGSGRAFCAWVDLREGESFGQTFTLEVDATKAVFVPRGIANGYQALEDNTVYTYLVNDHWKQESLPFYTSLNLADESANINWPIPLDKAELSEKDKANPRLEDVVAMKPRKTLITGAYGQLGTALSTLFPDAELIDRDSFDITDPAAYAGRNWRQYDTIINAAGYTAVDAAETSEGREVAWKVNAEAVRLLARIAGQNGITLVHISSDYVFDGTKAPHMEDENFAPLSVYGQSKAAGDIAASTTNRHYILRTSWVVGEGKNFINIMKELAEKGVEPKVVNDQIGRLTFTEDLAKGIKYLLDTKPAYGTYNLTNEGDSVSWAYIAALVFEKSGKNASAVTGVSTAEYYVGKEDIAPRPLQSELSLDKIKSAGFTPRDWREALDEYFESENKENS